MNLAAIFASALILETSARDRKSFSPEEAVAAKGAVDALVARGYCPRSAASIKGQITRKTIDFVSKRKLSLERIVREGKMEHLASILNDSEPLADQYKSISDTFKLLLATSHTTIEEICEQVGLDVNIANRVIATVNAKSPDPTGMPGETVLLPLSKTKGVKQWLCESGTRLRSMGFEEHDGAQFQKFDFESVEDATLFKLRFF